REAGGVVEDVLEDLEEAVGGRLDHQRRLRDDDVELHAVALAQAKSVDDLPQQRAKVDRRALLALDLRVDARDLPHLREEVLHPRDLHLRDAQKTMAVFGRLDRREHLRRGANRRERVLELVRYVRRERLSQLLVLFHAAGEALQRARKVADLVALLHSLEAFAQTSAAVEDLARFLAQLAQRPDDGRAHHERQDDRGDDGKREDLQDGKPDRGQTLPDVDGGSRHDAHG